MTNAELLEQIEMERRIAGFFAAIISYRIFEPREAVDDELDEALRESLDSLHALSEQIGNMDAEQWL